MTASRAELTVPASVTDKLTFQYIQKMERQKYRAFALTFFLVTISFLWLLFQFARGPGQDGPALFSNAMYSLASLIGAFWNLRTAYRGYRGPVVLGRRHCLAWAFVGLGQLANGSGKIYYGLHQYLLKRETPLPSYADIGFTLFCVFCLIGLMILPAQKKSKQLRLHVVIDALITILCLVGINWYFVVYPMLIQVKPSEMFQAIVGISYPCWDILLILALVLFAYQHMAPVLRPSLWVYSLAVISLVWADSSYVYLTNYGQYHSGTAAIDPFWFLGSFLIGLAPLYQYSAIAHLTYANNAFVPLTTGKAAAQTRKLSTFGGDFVLLQTFMIYSLFLLLLLITLYTTLFTVSTDLSHFLDVLCAIAFTLVIARYVLASYENVQLIHEKEQSRETAELLRKSTTSLSSVLEMDLLLSHIVTVGATELGFDSAALVMIEEYTRPLAEQTSLLIRATTSEAVLVMSWRTTGQAVPDCVPLKGKELEVLWRNAPAHAPDLIHQWHMEQNMYLSLFVPLVYQGKIQGSLAFSIRGHRQFNEREYNLARAFAEEAANAIEHAYLYELAREHELFAQAMSNVAARLNSVVATGMGLGNDIHSLICTEGANALRADLAILYVHHANGQLLPLGALACNLEPPTTPQEWPPISAKDYQTLLANSSQPTLLTIELPEPNGMRPSSSGSTNLRLPSTPAHVLPLQTTNGRAHSSSHTLPVTQPLVASVAQKPRQPVLTLQEALQRRSVSKAILAPLVVHRVPTGLLLLARTRQSGQQEKRAFASPDLELAQDFAEQAAIAFTNASLYQQLHTAHRHMQELDQLKDQFMATASHELRTPLSAVQGYLELLDQSRSFLPPEQQEFLRRANRCCDELVLLLNNVMDASRLEIEEGVRTTHLEQVSIHEVVESVVELIALQTRKEGRDVQITIPADLVAKADPTRLRQVIRNLSSNALKYSLPGTPLIFAAYAKLTPQPSVIVSISDRGKGIKPEDQSRLFQRFVRLERDLNSTVRGSGLGLYISQRLVESMNGRIWPESSGISGEGTTFYIQLPLA